MPLIKDNTSDKTQRFSGECVKACQWNRGYYGSVSLVCKEEEARKEKRKKEKRRERGVLRRWWFNDGGGEKRLFAVVVWRRTRSTLNAVEKHAWRRAPCRGGTHGAMEDRAAPWRSAPHNGKECRVILSLLGSSIGASSREWVFE
ncbi:uncharacterized protein DS421_14g466800 [Arachis hypogaea]|nr:uncharacterized protein DS421_14g466800 [Arachis hypogaea]